MPLLPNFVRYSHPAGWWSSRILDQQFGLVLEPEDLLQPLTIPALLQKNPAGYIRNWKSAASQKDFGSTVQCGSDKFQASLDVKQFAPNEITVKIADQTVTVEGIHDEKEDSHGHISRHFIRKYILPKKYDIDRVETKLSPDGVLTVTAPVLRNNDFEQRSIPITHTGEPARASNRKCDGDKAVCTTIS